MQKLEVVGLVLLILSIPFFYSVAFVPYEDVALSYDEVNPVEDGAIGRDSWQPYPFHGMHYIQVKPYKFAINSGESVYITCAPNDKPPPYIVLESEITLSVIDYTNSNQLSYMNNCPSDQFLEVFIATNYRGTYETTVSL